MKPTNLRLTLFLLFGFISMAGYSQTLLSTLSSYNTSYPEEKMYVHFDKPVYNPGETIWFKAYLTSHNFPSPISTNFYAELINAKGNVVSKKAYPIFEASAAGSFDLPLNSKEEGLVFRAYTTWMLNFDTAFLFVKPLKISAVTSKTTTAKPATQLRFFPEGGDLLADFESTLAFKATDANNFPVAVSGVIKEAPDKVITSFSTTHDGMGKILWEPSGTKEYYAEWQDGSGALQKTSLPRAKATGVLLEMKQSGNYVTYVMKRSAEVPADLKRVHLVGQMHQQLVYRATVNMEQMDITSGIIKLDSLTTGILQLTLFSNDWKPLAERIAFVNKGDYSFAASLSTPAKNLSKRGKNTIEIEVPDTLSANLSIAITDAQLASDGSDNIISKLLLTSDLRGYIHNPSYYFSSNADSVKAHLDLLMLTNGWRRYNWEALATGKLPEIKHPKEQYLSIKGAVYGASPAELSGAHQLNLVIQTKDSARRYLAAPIDKAGQFAVNGAIFFDTVSVFYSFNKGDKLNRSATVSFLPALQNNFTIGINAAQVIQQAANKPLASRSAFFAQKVAEVLPQINRKTLTLTEVVVQSKLKSREQELEKKYTSGLFQSGNSKNFNLMDDPFASTALNALTYLEGKVAGLQINSTGSGYSVMRRSDPPELFLDEQQVTADDLTSVPVSDIAYIKVFDPPFLGAFGNGPGGAIAVYRKLGGDSKRNVKGLEKSQVIGYAAAKEFYSPDYAKSSPLDDIEDVRSTIYWKPFILTDKNHRTVKLDFYNNDVSTSLRVVLEGMNEFGKLIRVEKIIQ
ncbi:MAG: hypothetical protein JWP69_536 [Flaviaesturariibacter sp.]|nr:hypothetical protein [Flaviaesturariibacter sp.]